MPNRQASGTRETKKKKKISKLLVARQALRGTALIAQCFEIIKHFLIAGRFQYIVSFWQLMGGEGRGAEVRLAGTAKGRAPPVDVLCNEVNHTMTTKM